MLQIKEIRKEYITGDLKQTALDGVSLNFRDNEFVGILGPSGSGKTTLLNIIGGLDRYDSGDLIINEISTKKYKDRDWDSYRNHTIGFVFQSYNLIPHQTVLANVELALTISGISKKERKRRAIEALEKVGLGNQLHKRPNQMSGGQMQRVAIARALVNDPDILLADEPTGALDSETSVQVMDLLAEVAKDRLVIMVTHNPELAEEYATRIVKLKDGKIIDDSDPFEIAMSDTKKPEHKKMGKASMSLLTSLGLSFNNLRTKKGRTLLTAFAGSIGIIGISLILSLSNGVNTYIDDIQKESMSSYPISIDSQTMDMSALMDDAQNSKKDNDNVDHDMDGVYVNSSDIERKSTTSKSITKNNLTAFKKYLDDENSDIHKYIGENGIVYTYDTKFGVYTYDENGVFVNTDGSTLNDLTLSSSINMGMMGATSSKSSNFSQLIAGTDNSSIGKVIRDNYDVLYGKIPENYDEIVLVLDNNNEVSATALYELGILPTQEYNELMSKIDSGKEITIESKKLDYSDICAREYYLIPQCDLYIKNNDDTYDDISSDNAKIENLINESIRLKIVGIIKPNENSKVDFIDTPIGYTPALTNYLIDYTNNSDIVKKQRENKNLNVINGVSYESNDDVLLAMGVVSLDAPSSIDIYADDFESKDSISDCINNYNETVDEADQITYTDYVGLLMSSVTTIVNVISYVLIAFVAVSLIVSSIMIGIITYISVLERTKEIGILRAIGASKKNISQVFNAETFIIGLCSGLIGIGTTLLLLIPGNAIIHSITGSDSVNASLPLANAIILILLSVILTLIGGFIPSKKAAKKDPVTALRTE